MSGVCGEGEAGPPQSRELSVGLDPRILGSQLELKADAQLTEPPRCPWSLFYYFFKGFIYLFMRDTERER